MSQEKRSWFESAWFYCLMAVVSVGMLAEYTRIVLTVNNSPRKIFAPVIWLGMATHKTWLRRNRKELPGVRNCSAQCDPGELSGQW